MHEEIQARADQLAELMERFRLEEAKLEGEDWQVAFRKKRREPRVVAGPQSISTHAGQDHAHDEHAPEPTAVIQAGPTGTPVSSPMTGIYYSAPSPSAPPFVKEGDTVNAGQVVGLIEAMKVFNEIVAPMSGPVSKIVAKSGDVVNPGEPLLYIG